MKTKNWSTSQKCPQVPCYNFRENPTSTMQHMFLEDFCHGFSFDLAANKNDGSFYDVCPSNSFLKKLLSFQDYHFLRYDMDKLLSRIVRTLVFSGKAFIELVVTTDTEKNIVGISLIPFDPIISVPGKTRNHFVALQKDKRLRFFSIQKRDCVVFRLSDLGFSRYFLRRLYKKLSRYDVLSAGDMSLSPKKTGFDFTVWNDRREFRILQTTPKLGWYGRNQSNPHMGEAYLLYRIIKLKILRQKFLNYFLKQLNQKIEPICKDYGITGTLIAKQIQFSYDELLKKLTSGEMNYSQIGDYLFRFR